MTRASLGHTGRELRVSRPVALAYILISLAAIIRLSGAIFLTDIYEETVLAAGTVWIVASWSAS